MHIKYLNFEHSRVELLFDADSNEIFQNHPAENLIWICDMQVYMTYPTFFEGKNCIPVIANEANKIQLTVDEIINKLLHAEADKTTVLVGIGGGIVTDITGYVASVYKRGIACIQIPTSILAMVDAAIGGKNGVNVHGYKNMVGTIYQPKKIIFDLHFLKSLPEIEWVNGFAEIIKHACIHDAEMFTYLENHSLKHFIQNRSDLAALIEKNVDIKSAIVLQDEKETGNRKLLNFGHTLGHAIENSAGLPHGFAIAIGMMLACKVSEKTNGLSKDTTERIKKLLLQYHLPVSAEISKESVWKLLLADKKRDQGKMNFIVLNKIGEAKVQAIALDELKIIVEEIL